MEDSLLELDKLNRNESEITKGTNRTSVGCMVEHKTEASDKEEIGIKIGREIENEEFGKKGDTEISPGYDMEENQQELGLYMNQEGLSSPIFGKIKGKRGRKTLKELREIEGLSREQRKIDELLKMGKGKCLPKAS